MSAWLPTAPCTPGGCVAVPGPAVAVPVRVARLAACLTVLVVGIAAVPLVRASARLPRARLVRLWTRLLLASLGVRIRVTAAAGPPSGTGALVVANHISWLDILLVSAVRPGRMLAKTEVGRWPVLGPLTALGGTIFLERDRLRALPGTVAEIAAALRAGERVVVFPEGSTWCGRAGGRFRPALFEAAVRAGVPVQPLTIGYRLADGAATTAPAFVGDDGLLASLWRVVAVRGLRAEVDLLPEIPPGVHAGRRGLAAAAQHAVEAARGPHCCPGPVPVPAHRARTAGHDPAPSGGPVEPQAGAVEAAAAPV